MKEEKVGRILQKFEFGLFSRIAPTTLQFTLKYIIVKTYNLSIDSPQLGKNELPLLVQRAGAGRTAGAPLGRTTGAPAGGTAGATPGGTTGAPPRGTPRAAPGGTTGAPPRGTGEAPPGRIAGAAPRGIARAPLRGIAGAPPVGIAGSPPGGKWDLPLSYLDLGLVTYSYYEKDTYKYI
uniref:Uncharacterized protein n=1 Tax=Amphimedon queenslandica TaxID=400682 RepID=A0A1X7TNU0_AMPQE